MSSSSSLAGFLQAATHAVTVAVGDDPQCVERPVSRAHLRWAADQELAACSSQVGRAVEATALRVELLRQRREELERSGNQWQQSAPLVQPRRSLQVSLQLLQAPLDCALDLLEGPKPARVWSWDPLGDLVKESGRLDALFSATDGECWLEMRPELEQSWQSLMHAASARPQAQRGELIQKGGSGLAAEQLRAAIEGFVRDVEGRDPDLAERLQQEALLLPIEVQIRSGYPRAVREGLLVLQRLLEAGPSRALETLTRVLCDLVRVLCKVGECRAARDLCGRLSGLSDPQSVVCRIGRQIVELPLEREGGLQAQVQGLPLALLEGWRDCLLAGLQRLSKMPQESSKGLWTPLALWTLEQPLLGEQWLQIVLEETDPKDWRLMLRDRDYWQLSLPGAHDHPQLERLDALLCRRIQQEFRETMERARQHLRGEWDWLPLVLEEWSREMRPGNVHGAVEALVAWQLAWERAECVRHRSPAGVWVESLIGCWASAHLRPPPWSAVEGGWLDASGSIVRLRSALKPFERALEHQLRREILGPLAGLECAVQLLQALLHQLSPSPSGHGRGKGAASGREQRRLQALCLETFRRGERLLRGGLDPAASRVECGSLLANIEELERKGDPQSRLVAGLTHERLALLEESESLVESCCEENRYDRYLQAKQQAYRRLLVSAAVSPYGPDEASMLIAWALPGGVRSVQVRPPRIEECADLVRILIEQAIEMELFEFATGCLQRLENGECWMDNQTLDREGMLLGMVVRIEQQPLLFDPVLQQHLGSEWVHSTRSRLMERIELMALSGPLEERRRMDRLLSHWKELTPT